MRLAHNSAELTLRSPCHNLSRLSVPTLTHRGHALEAPCVDPPARGLLLSDDRGAFVLAPFSSLGYRPRMPRDGALTLLDVRSPTLAIVCGPCDRRGRYAVTKLLEEHGDAKLTDLLVTLADCPKTRSASVRDRCKAVYEGLAAH